MVRHVVKKSRFSGDWAVYLESSLGFRNVPCRRVSEWFRTWREAMDYADRRSRTVEVVLPRRTVLPTDRHVVQTCGLIIEYRAVARIPACLQGTSRSSRRNAAPSHWPYFHSQKKRRHKHD